VADRRRSVRLGERRGVSEAIGFVLVFGVIITSVGVVYVTGFESLRETRNAEQATNAERAFDVLKANLEDMSKRGAPSRATEIKLADAELSTGEPVRMTINATNTSNASDFTVFTFRYEPLVYDTGDSAIVYANGAVLRRSRGGTAVVQPPEFVVSGERTLMPLVHTYSDGETGTVAGSETVLVRTQLTASALHIVRTEPGTEYNVSVTIEGPRAEAWARYFQGQGMTCPTVTDDEMSCHRTPVERVQVSRIYVEVLFE
jgi:hypothetical protein